jgi:hypothetical protein
VTYFILNRLFAHRGVSLDLLKDGRITGFAMADTIRNIRIILVVLNSIRG